LIKSEDEERNKIMRPEILAGRPNHLTGTRIRERLRHLGAALILAPLVGHTHEPGNRSGERPTGKIAVDERRLLIWVGELFADHTQRG
jgi:hypothetical protein